MSRPGPSLRYFEPAAGAVHRCSFSSVALDLGESSSGGALAPRANPATSGRWSMRSFGEYAFLGRFSLRESSEKCTRRENRRRCVRVSADLSRCFDLFIGLGRTAVLRGRSVTISELTMLDRHEQRDGLRLGGIGPTTIAFTQALNPRPATGWGRETATVVGWAVNSVSAPARTIALTSGSGSGAGGSVLGCRRLFGK